MDDEIIDDNVSNEHYGVIGNPDDGSPASENPLPGATTVVPPIMV